MKKVKMIIAAIFLIGVFIGNLQAFDISLQAKDWDIQWSQGTAIHPKDLANESGWFLTFPLKSEGWVSYVTKRFQRDLTQYKTITITAEFFPLRGDPKFICETECSDAGMHIYIQRRFINWWNEDHRWWANPISFILIPTEVTLVIPLTPDQWSNVNGHKGNEDFDRENGFYRTLTNPGRIGITFGGGGNFGHGISIIDGTGTGQFILTKYSLD